MSVFFSYKIVLDCSYMNNIIIYNILYSRISFQITVMASVLVLFIGKYQVPETKIPAIIVITVNLTMIVLLVVGKYEIIYISKMIFCNLSKTGSIYIE